MDTKPMNKPYVVPDTIAAVATPAGSGGIAIVRISGDQALAVLDAVFEPHNQSKRVGQIKSHTLTYGVVKDEDGTEIDQVMVGVMKGPASYTREDIVEINCHGGIVSVRRVLGRVLAVGRKLGGVRMAEPGEFTKRAFFNGRIDLAQAEAVMDVISSKTEGANRAAVAQSKGKLSLQVKALRDEILLMLAHIEASIDYPEHDIESMNLYVVEETTAKLRTQIDRLIRVTEKGKWVREGIETAIIGRPNVGKSSLLNAILQEDRAIVTDVPGTTRDTLCEYANVHGVPLKVVDTAGIRHTADPVEQIGVERGWQYTETADLILFIVDRSMDISEEDVSILEKLKEKKLIILLNKSDLKPKAYAESFLPYANKGCVISCSVKDGTGLDELFDKIRELFFAGEIDQAEDFMGNVRHGQALRQADQALSRVLDAIEDGMTEDVVAIDLMDAFRVLGEITGETVSEDVVDRIFSEFCLGK